MATSAATGVATQSYIKLLSAKTAPFRIIDVWPAAVTIDRNRMRNSVSVERAAVAQTAKERTT